ncbi:MAG: ankyrin repeat domain-containing protein [Alphaproteobacteria bacterium]|nr:ankyrin repeat domain-containing protein [Alphaproteobacteria bacterium]
MIRQLDCNKIKQSVISNLIEKLKTNKELAFETDDNGNTLLHHIVQYEETEELIVSLVKCGVHLKSKNKQGNTPLHIAAGHSAKNAVLLMRVGAKDNVINNKAQLPEDIFHQTFPEKCWFDIMPVPQIILTGSHCEMVSPQNTR